MMASLAASAGSKIVKGREVPPEVGKLRAMGVVSAKVKRRGMTLMCGQTLPGVGCIIADWLSHSAASTTRP
jgi:hypothetical protein